jgi:hypothetical protein
MDKFYDLIAWVMVVTLMIGISIYFLSIDSPTYSFRADIQTGEVYEYESGV